MIYKTLKKLSINYTQCISTILNEQIENKELQQRWPVFILPHDQRNVHAADIEQVSDCFQISPDAYLCTAYPVEDEEYYIYSEPIDHSSLKIYTTFQKPQFVAGIFLLASYWFQIPPQVS
ncbi:hypothetical protein BgiMline_026975, partial [Biomphalaria glabrata]